MEYWLNAIAFYVKKHIPPRAVCYNFLLVRDKPLGICETRLWENLRKHNQIKPDNISWSTSTGA